MRGQRPGANGQDSSHSRAAATQWGPDEERLAGGEGRPEGLSVFTATLLINTSSSYRFLAHSLVQYHANFKSGARVPLATGCVERAIRRATTISRSGSLPPSLKASFFTLFLHWVYKHYMASIKLTGNCLVLLGRDVFFCLVNSSFSLSIVLLEIMMARN